MRHTTTSIAITSTDEPFANRPTKGPQPDEKVNETTSPNEHVLPAL